MLGVLNEHYRISFFIPIDRIVAFRVFPLQMTLGVRRTWTKTKCHAGVLLGLEALVEIRSKIFIEVGACRKSKSGNACQG
jgi:hypothetical protein